MRGFYVGLAILFAAPALAADAPADLVRKRFASKFTAVTWGDVSTFDPTSELEIGDGYGHGFSLGWIRFRPDKNGVYVLSIQYEAEFNPYCSKWPPDIAPVKVTLARMTTEAYVALLKDMAIVNSATVKDSDNNTGSVSSSDFWVQARLTHGKKTSIDLDWAGYKSSLGEVEYKKPQIAVELVHEAMEKLKFKAYTLTAADRTWASERFVRHWEKHQKAEFYWWVNERAIVTIGVVGDATALPALRNAMAGDPKKHSVYLAINAITRLTKNDLRDKPVEEMDVEKTRKKVLESLRDVK